MRVSLSKDASGEITVSVSGSNDLQSELSISHSFQFDRVKDNDKITVEVFDKDRHVGHSLVNYGKKLFRALFQEETLSLKLLQEILPPKSDGPILLELKDNSDLDDIAWEYAWAGNEYLVRQCMFARVHPRAGPQLAELPLRIVVVAPDPLDSDTLGLANLHLSEQFQNFIDEYYKNSRKVILDRVLPATVNKMDSLLADMQSETSTVLHFMGHCDKSRNGARALLFEHRDTGLSEFVNTPRLISEPSELRLAFLSACNTREVARTLVQQGVHHTIGSYCNIPDDIARKFEAHFYQCLAQGQSVEKAMLRTRLEIADMDDYRQRDHLVGAMILYSTTFRASGGLFRCPTGIPKVNLHIPHNNLDVKIPTTPIFCGRKKELAELNLALRRMATRSLQSCDMRTITGISGEGKTILGRKAVEQVQYCFPGGIFAWQFRDDTPISTADYLWELVNTVLPDEANKIFPNGKPAPSFANSCDIHTLGWNIFRKIEASCLLILDHADTLRHARNSSRSDVNALSLWILLQEVSSSQTVPIKFLATSHEPLRWPREEVMVLDNFLSDISGGIDVFIQNLDITTFNRMNNEVQEIKEEAKRMEKNDEREMIGNTDKLLHDLLLRVDGHPLCLELLAQAASKNPDTSLKTIVGDSYQILFKDNHSLNSLESSFSPMINTLPIRQQLLLYSCSLFNKPVDSGDIIKVSKFFDYKASPMERPEYNSHDSIIKDVIKLCDHRLLFKDGENRYRCHVAVSMVTVQLSNVFKLQKDKGKYWAELGLRDIRDFPYLLGEDIQLEIIDTPTIFETGTRREISHADLPIVSEALSITLRFKLLSHSREYGRIFQKGIDGTNVRTPTLFLAPNTSQLHPCFSTTKDWNVHLFVGDSLVLGRTYHFTYAISATEGRLDVYINGVLAGFKCVTDIVTEQIVFNNEPLRMGNFESYASAKCEIVDFTYYNWKLSKEEIEANFQQRQTLQIINNPISFQAGTRRDVSHTDLPIVSDALSITLRFKLQSRSNKLTRIFQKGINGINTQTPALFLEPLNMRLYLYFSTTTDENVYVGGPLVIGRTYHFTYTLSAFERRLDVYIDGVLAGFKHLEDVVADQLVFNKEPLFIGSDDSLPSPLAEISDFTYYNWKLSVEEVQQSFGRRKSLQIVTTPTLLLKATTKGPVVPHTTLPIVSEELSITLLFKLSCHSDNWGRIFQKGSDRNNTRTPALFLEPQRSRLHTCFSTTTDWNVNDFIGDPLVVGRTYHLAYTLSRSERRMDIYINGMSAGFKTVGDVYSHILFNDEPFFIGSDEYHPSAICEIRNLQFHNWKLSAEEVTQDYKDQNY